MSSPSHAGPSGNVFWFIAVGCTAAAVHWITVALLVSQAGWPPLGANAAGWLVALGVSFSGHHWLSFRGHGTAVRTAGLRFVGLSAAGFAINEASYALLLRWTPLRYDLLLALVLVAVAVGTYLLSRHWAFRSTPAH